MASIADLAADLADMERLVAQAQRPQVRAMLNEHLRCLRDEYTTRISTSHPESEPAARAPASASAPALEPATTKTASAVTGTAAPSPPVASPPPPAPMPLPNRSTSTSGEPAVTYVSFPSFGWDQDSYGSEPAFVHVYLTSGLDGIGDVKDRVTCQFTKSSFDLRIHDFNGKCYRLYKNNLDKEIAPEESKVIVKKNQIKVKLRKVKGTYGYDSWLDLTAKKPKFSGGKESDPGSDLMDMMKQMYDDGDDDMKKTLGEAMLKSRNKVPGAPMDDLDM